jgi:hypothetical protein
MMARTHAPSHAANTSPSACCAGVGVLALERYNLRYADDVRARLELARAYSYAQDDLNARREFEAIAKPQRCAPA